MKRVLSLFLAVLLSCNNQSSMLNEEEFTTQYLQVLQKQNLTVKYHIDSTLTVTANVSGKEYKHFLDNAYREYQADPDSLAQTFSKYALATKELYESDEQLRADRIVPIIKSKDFLEEANRIGKAVVYENYNSELIIVYGEDNEKNIKYFDKDDFTKINLTQDSLLPIALENLDRILPKLERMGDKENYMLVAGGDYDDLLPIAGPARSRVSGGFDLLPIAGPARSRVSGGFKLDSSGGRHYLIGR